MTGWQIARRILLLVITALSLYLLAPKVISVLASWPQLKTLKPGWRALALLFESMSYLSGRGDFGQDLVIDSQNRIIAAGYTANGGDTEFALARVFR
jgi:hypothetical protein